MPVNNYQLRSKDVQEVLSAPPKAYILWGNTIIISLLVSFILSLYFYKVPINSQLPFKIVKVQSRSGENIELEALINIPISGKFPSENKVQLDIEQFRANRVGRLSAAIESIEKVNHIIYFQLPTDSNNLVVSELGNRASLTTGMFGIVEVHNGSISLLNLFLNKMINR